MYIVLVIFLVLLLSVLFMPIHVRINPEEGQHLHGKAGILRLNIDLDEEKLISVTLYFFYLRFSWYPLQNKNGQPAKKKESNKKSRVNIMSWNRLKFLINVAWQSVKKSKLRILYLDLDTRNVIINANLYPVFELMSKRPGINLNINYAGNFALVLDVENNLWNVVRIFLWNFAKRIIHIN